MQVVLLGSLPELLFAICVELLGVISAFVVLKLLAVLDGSQQEVQKVDGYLSVIRG